MRLLVACSLFASWLVLLLVGFVLGGASHLLLVASIVCFFAARPQGDATR